MRDRHRRRGRKLEGRHAVHLAYSVQRGQSAINAAVDKVLSSMLAVFHLLDALFLHLEELLQHFQVDVLLVCAVRHVSRATSYRIEY